MNVIEYQNKKNIKIEQYYENYIKSLNDQIYQLESQIEILQGKVSNISGNYIKENENEYNLKVNLLREQIIYLQTENQKLTQMLKMKENNKNANIYTNIKSKKIIKQNKKRIQMPISQSNRSKKTNESENEYVKQFINEFHKQIDDLNIDSNQLINENNQSISNKNNDKINLINNKDHKYINNENIEDENNEQNEEYYNNNANYPNDNFDNNYLNNSNNSNDIIYQGEKNNLKLNYNNINSKNNEDIKINEKLEINNIKNNNNNNDIIDNDSKLNEMNIDNKIKIKN